MSESMPTKLVVAVVQIDDVHELMRRLVEQGLGATRIDAAGGFLRRENAVVLVATVEAGMAGVMAAIQQSCRKRNATWFPTIDDGTIGLYTEPVEVEIGGAVVFVLPIERVELLSERPSSGQLAGVASIFGGAV